MVRKEREEEREREMPLKGIRWVLVKASVTYSITNVQGVSEINVGSNVVIVDVRSSFFDYAILSFILSLSSPLFSSFEEIIMYYVYRLIV